MTCYTGNETKPVVKKEFVANVPSFELVSPGSSRIEQGGVSIVVEPIGKPKVVYKKFYEPATPIIGINGKDFVNEITTPALALADEKDLFNTDIKFKMTIFNNSKNVLRMSSSVLTSDIDGTSNSINTNKSNQKISSAIITPGKQKSYDLNILDLSYFDNKAETKGTVVIALYELKVGGSSFNFEWVYNYTNKNIKIKAYPRKTEHKYVDRSSGLSGRTVFSQSY